MMTVAEIADELVAKLRDALATFDGLSDAEVLRLESLKAHEARFIIRTRQIVREYTDGRG